MEQVPKNRSRTTTSLNGSVSLSCSIWFDWLYCFLFVYVKSTGNSLLNSIQFDVDLSVIYSVNSCSYFSLPFFSSYTFLSWQWLCEEKSLLILMKILCSFFFLLGLWFVASWPLDSLASSSSKNKEDEDAEPLDNLKEDYNSTQKTRGNSTKRRREE